MDKDWWGDKLVDLGFGLLENFAFAGSFVGLSKWASKTTKSLVEAFKVKPKGGNLFKDADIYLKNLESSDNKI